MKFSDISIHLSRFCVGIAGAGGLGSNCAIALTRSGVGHLVITDFDKVTENNLNRQYFFGDQVGMVKVDALKININRIDQSTKVTVYNNKLVPSLIREIYDSCDILVEAFDEASEKQMFIETILETWPGKPLIVGSGMAGFGNNNELNQRELGENLYVCGDETREVSEKNPPMAPRVGIVANMQANLVVDLLMNMKK
ncbi:MAG: sulfur carrier protein ThiS adenylyltransferase ThiF [Bacteroidales bacterium]|nr:sulfur carrier protein ThiS adenylyltransferase ThiF [Bacteroidales bacterium]